MKQLCTFLVLLASACAYGQTGPISITSTECAPIGVGVRVSVITFQVTGTWTGTLQPKITVQGQAAANVQVTPSTSSTAQSTVTANGIYTAQVNGADTFQVCGATVASGTAVVYLNTSVASKGGGGSGGGGSGTVTSVATTSPIGGGTITSTGTVTCTTCVVASSPGAGVAHFAGSTQTATSSAVVAADITSGTITGTQLSSSIALPNGATATTQSASDNSTKVATTAYADRAGSVSDGLSFGTLAIGAVASGASIASNSITVATTGVVYVFCGSWGSGTATLTLTDTLTSTITSLGDTGDNTTSFNSRMHAWKVVPASNGSDAFTCAGAAAGSHVDVAALYYPTAGNRTVDVSAFGNVNGDQTGKNLSVTPSTTDRIILVLFTVNTSAEKFLGFSGFDFPVVQNQTTSGNTFLAWERRNFPAGTFSPTAYGITNQPMHMAILGVN